VLDFGLAKVMTAATVSESTETRLLTEQGVIIGSAPYISPEQAEGKPVDARSDIFSFGAVLYEMITGQRAFSGESRAAILAAVLQRDPKPPSSITETTPAELERLIVRCLRKDSNKRCQHMSDVKLALEELRDDSESGKLMRPVSATPQTHSSMGRWLWPSLAAVFAVIATIAGWALWQYATVPMGSVRFQVPPPENARNALFLSLSPDGRKLVFSNTGSLWIRDLDALEWRRLPGTEGATGNSFWSPDSKFLGFGVQNQLKKIDVSGGRAQTLCTVQNGLVLLGAWNRDGVIVFRGGDTLWKISQAGGVPTAITSLDTSRDEQFHAIPTFMPDGRHFIYLRYGSPEVSGIYAGSPDAKPEEQSREGHRNPGLSVVRKRVLVLHAREHPDGATVRRGPAAIAR
jgi:eukaryotic-like serine/threonine-protein kinase